MRIALIDSLYPEFIRSIPFDTSSTYDVELRKVLDWKFGTFDAMSRNLGALGHSCVDVVANHEPLQAMWRSEHGQTRGLSVLDSQIYHFNPDVLFLQDLALKPRFVTRPPIVAAQCSCAFDPATVKQCDVIFTSLPTHVPKFEKLGVRAIYLPLAFEPSVLEGPQPERDIDISFVGGVGRDAHWRSGTDILEAVAAAFPTRFVWWGYGLGSLPASSALRGCYKGKAFGRDLYSIYRRSKVVVNRHGEVSEGYANNLRLFEGSGCGALVITEAARNLGQLFTLDEMMTYESVAELATRIEYFLQCESSRRFVAENGKRRTLRDHTYQSRMKVVSDTLQETMCHT